MAVIYLYEESYTTGSKLVTARYIPLLCMSAEHKLEKLFGYYLEL
jgi:hypothetical protein